FFWAVMRASQTAEKIATAEPARIQGNDRPGATPDNRRPQDWQNLDPARISASQRRQRWVISAAPQLAQILPVASASHTEHCMGRKDSCGKGRGRIALASLLCLSCSFPYFLRMSPEANAPKPARFDPPLTEIRSRPMGELARGEVRWDVVLETVS